MNDRRLLSELKTCGALLEGHFLLSSGLHSARYFQCALFLQHPAKAEAAGRELALHAPSGARAVVSPALGGLMIGHEVARALGVRHVFTERVDGAMALRRGFSFAPGEPVVVVEDVFTTGKSTREVLAVIRQAGADPIAALSLVDRCPGALDLGVPAQSLLKLGVDSFEPSACELCRKGIPAKKPGSRTQAAVRGGA